MVIESDANGDETMEKTNETDFIPNLSQTDNSSDRLPQMQQSDEIDTIVSKNELAVQTDQMYFMHREVQTDHSIHSIITRDQATQTEQDQQDVQNALKDSNGSLDTPPDSPNSPTGSCDSPISQTAIEDNRKEWNNAQNLDSREDMKLSNDGKLLLWLHYFEFHG